MTPTIRAPWRLAGVAAAAALVAGTTALATNSGAASLTPRVASTAGPYLLYTPLQTAPFELKAYSFDVEGVPSATGGSAGGTKVDDVVVTKSTDTSSPGLMLAMATGAHLGYANLYIAVRKAGRDQLFYVEFKFTDVTVTAISYTSDDDSPSESVTLAAAAVSSSVVSQT